MSSSQCSNCGESGHFRADCQRVKNPSLEHWRSAKKQFRRENPEEGVKLRRMMEDNQKWKMEGDKIPFYLIDREVKKMLQCLFELDEKLDLLGRPKDWEEVNNQLDSFLPFIRELVHNAKGFQQSKRQMYDLEIFEGRIADLEEKRDHVVRKVKSLVNGKLGKLAAVNSKNSPEVLLQYIYATHPPKCVFVYKAAAHVTVTLREALLQYHPDNQTEASAEWKCICEAIYQCLTSAMRQARSRSSRVDPNFTSKPKN